MIFVFRLQKLENIKGTSKKEVTTFYAMPIISIKTYLKSIYPFEDILICLILVTDFFFQ